MWMRKNTIYIVELFASLWICGGKKKGQKNKQMQNANCVQTNGLWTT